MDLTSITIIDALDVQSKLQSYLNKYKQIKYYQEFIIKDNYEKIFEKYLSSNDILLDLAFNLEARCLLKWCHDHNIYFVNTSIELWDSFGNRSISERDTQITDQPKKVNEFVNTWLVESLTEEAIAPAEMRSGTHERNIPRGLLFHDEKKGSCNLVCLTQKGMNSLVHSWVTSGEIIGMVIRHGEAYDISKLLTIYKDDENNNLIIYHPTVHYAYLPSDSTINSLIKYRMHNYQLQSETWILNDDITDGADEVGVLLS